jgi:hypothetical protein
LQEDYKEICTEKFDVTVYKMQDQQVKDKNGQVTMQEVPVPLKKPLKKPKREVPPTEAEIRTAHNERKHKLQQNEHVKYRQDDDFEEDSK